MALLAAKDESIQWTLAPLSFEAAGEREWIAYSCRVTQGSRELLSARVSLTSSDVVDLTRLLAGGSASEESRRFESTDADFEVYVLPVDPEGDAAIALFAGEPYVVMKGIKLVVDATRLASFAASLTTELDRFIIDGVRP
jgi:hypothetical protein